MRLSDVFKQQEKKAFWSFMAILGVLQLPYVISQDTNASIYDESVCWHAPVASDTQRNTIYRMQSKKQANNKKKAFCSFMAILVVVQLPYRKSYDTNIAVYDKSVCWHASVSKNTQMDAICRMQGKKRAILGVLKLPYVNSQDINAQVYDASVRLHSPVSKDAQTDTICRMQSKKPANNKKKGILVIYGHFRGVVSTIQ